jgi:ankyrin repeat protein
MNCAVGTTISGFDVDSKLAEDKKSRTAFIYACGKNKLELVRLCVERGANINTRTYSYVRNPSSNHKNSVGAAKLTLKNHCLDV